MRELSPKAYSLNIFLPEGDPDGLRIFDRTTRSGVGLVFPRSRYNEAKTRDELQRTGVYILVGSSDDSSQPILYIGEGDPVRPRIDSHYGKKEFWVWAVVFVTKDSSLNKAHVRYLEYRLIQLAREAKQAKLDNAVSTTEPSLSVADQADMESYLADLLSMLPLVGLSVFEKPDPGTRDVETLIVRRKKVEARGYEGANGFVVLAGSGVSSSETTSCHNYLRTLRKDLRAQGVIEETEQGWTFTQNYAFGSPSTAAGVVFGGNANGREEWKAKDGRTLKEIQIAAADETTSTESEQD